MGLVGLLVGLQRAAKGVIQRGNHVGTTSVCPYGLELGSKWAVIGFQLGILHVTHLTWVPHGFSPGHCMSTIRVSPYGLMWVSNWVSGGLQMGNLMLGPCVYHQCFPIWA